MRLSREAPIPVINQEQRYTVPGGAMNTAVNARALGAEVYVAGIVGDDTLGQNLRNQMSQRQIHHQLLLTAPGRATSSKLRVMANNKQGVIQHVARIDNIDSSLPDESVVRQIIALLEELIPVMDGVILSDYDNGFMGLSLIDAALSLARSSRCVIIADAHGGLERFQKVTAITPNDPEAEAATAIRIHDKASLELAGNRLLDMTDAHCVLITRGSDGMSLFSKNESPFHIPVWPVEARDTNGAGDTAAAAFTLAMAAGATPRESAQIANVAASIVVQHLGCATTSVEELLQRANAYGL